MMNQNKNNNPNTTTTSINHDRFEIRNQIYSYILMILCNCTVYINIFTAIKMRNPLSKNKSMKLIKFQDHFTMGKNFTVKWSWKLFHHGFYEMRVNPNLESLFMRCRSILKCVLVFRNREMYSDFINAWNYRKKRWMKIYFPTARCVRKRFESQDGHINSLPDVMVTQLAWNVRSHFWFG